MENGYALIKRIKNGDMTAFDYIYNQTNKSVYYSAYLILKDEDLSLDVMQETYLELLNKIDKVPDDVNIGGYLSQVAKNKSINIFNRKKKEKEYANSLKDYSYSKQDFDTGLVDEIRQTLNEKEFMVFMLKVVGEYSFKEIAKLKNIPLGTATWLYQEARKKLETKFKGARN